MAGNDWLQSYLSECNISLRTPEANSIARAMDFNKVEVRVFFRNLKQVRQENAFTAHYIYNVDEYGLSTVPTKLPKVLSLIGTRRVAEIVRREREREREREGGGT